jgi:hypothetical protein
MSKVITNVRMESAAGHYLGSVDFEAGFLEPYDRDSLYYPNEEWVKHEFPNSISMNEAIEKAKLYKWMGGK